MTLLGESATTPRTENPTNPKRKRLRHRQHSDDAIVAVLGIEVTLHEYGMTTVEGVAQQLDPRFVHHAVLVITKSKTHAQVRFAIKAKYGMHRYVIGWRPKAFLPVNAQKDDSTLVLLSGHVW